MKSQLHRYGPSAFLAGIASFILLAGSVLASPPGEEPPADVFSRLEDAGTASDHEGVDHLIVLTETVNKVKPSGVTYVDGYELTKVLTPEGCRDQSVLSWHYDPQSSYVEVREVNIMRDGERVPVDGAVISGRSTVVVGGFEIRQFLLRRTRDPGLGLDGRRGHTAGPAGIDRRPRRLR